MKLTNYQKQAARFLLERKKGILNMGCRTGKSIVSLLAAKKVGTPVVVAPPTLRHHWHEEAKKADMEIKFISPFKKGDIDDAKKSKVVIIDEAHKYLKRGKIQLINLAKQADYAFMLTATPLINGPEDLFWQLKIAGAWSYSWREFATTFYFCRNHPVYPGVLMLGKPKQLQILKYILEKACFRYFREENIEIHEKILSANKPITEVMNIEDISLQNSILANSKINDKEFRDYILNIRKHYKKVVGFFFHKDIGKQMYEYTKDKASSYLIDGDIPIAKRIRELEKFNACSNGIFYINYKSCGEGLDIRAVSSCVFLERTWSPKSDYQAYMRCYGFSRDTPLHIHYIYYKDEHKSIVNTSKKENYDDF